MQELKIVTCRLATRVKISNRVKRPTPDTGRPEKGLTLTWKIADDALEQSFEALYWSILVKLMHTNTIKLSSFVSDTLSRKEYVGVCKRNSVTFKFFDVLWYENFDEATEK